MPRNVPDRRVRRTRRQLHEALIALILERGWDAVSVLEICDRADVGRSTFYVHFADKEELLLSGFDDLHAALDHVRVAAAAPFGFAETLIEHAGENLPLFRAVIGKKSGAPMMRHFRDVVLRLVESDLERLGIPAADRPLVARFVGGGFVEMLVAWLDRPSSLAPSALAAAFRGLAERAAPPPSPGRRPRAGAALTPAASRRSRTAPRRPSRRRRCRSARPG